MEFHYGKTLVPKVVQVIGYIEDFRYNTALCKTK